jgi:divalent metal cation (Fe/Co/Zn/Cd) transporter
MHARGRRTDGPERSARLGDEERARARAGLVSLTVSLVLLAAKFEAWRRTGSTAVLSDALESIVNVLAALFAGVELRALDSGLAIIAAAGTVNALLGVYLVRTGRRFDSLTLVADGKHVLSDSVTSAGVVLGLFLVRLTGQTWLDPLAACLVALYLFRTGFHLVRAAAAGLLDEEDTELLGRLVAVLGPRIGGGIIRLHQLRAMKAGRYHHVDAHLVVPEFWSVERAHHVSDDLAAQVIAELGIEGELVFHTDPCRRAYCSACDLADCPVRREPFRSRVPLTVEEAVRPDEPHVAEIVAGPPVAP